jgi:hypothetical protein
MQMDNWTLASWPPFRWRRHSVVRHLFRYCRSFQCSNWVPFNPVPDWFRHRPFFIPVPDWANAGQSDMPEKSKSGIGMFYVSLLRQSGIDNNAQSVTADYCLVRHCPLLHSAQLCHVTGPWRQARLFTCCKDSLVMVESPELLRTFQFPFSFLCRLL